MIRIKVPATSANCCVGFDSLGMALTIYNEFIFEENNKIEIFGCDKEYADENNIVVVTVKKLCEKLGKPVPNFKLTINSNIPIGRGLGSSSTLTIAGVLFVNEYYNLHMNSERMLETATEIEGHPDNVSPALLGGLVVSKLENENLVALPLELSEWKLLVAIPKYEVKTGEARKVIPTELSHKSAAKQVANAVMLTTALRTGNEKILRESSEDFLHEPYRKKLIKEYETLKSIADELNLAFWISGSGSTMIALTTDEKKLTDFEEKVKSIDVELRRVAIDRVGATFFTE